jgi:hypothetical protein
LENQDMEKSNPNPASSGLFPPPLFRKDRPYGLKVKILLLTSALLHFFLWRFSHSMFYLLPLGLSSLIPFLGLFLLWPNGKTVGAFLGAYGIAVLLLAGAGVYLMGDRHGADVMMLLIGLPFLLNTGLLFAAYRGISRTTRKEF